MRQSPALAGKPFVCDNAEAHWPFLRRGESAAGIGWLLLKAPELSVSRARQGRLTDKGQVVT
jgi:hypothetical protein